MALFETAQEPIAAKPEEPRFVPRRLQKLERALIALVAVLLVGSVEAIGSVHTVVLVPFALVAIAAAIVAIPVRDTAPPDRAWPAPALLLIGLSLFTALQAVPLPLSFLAKIAPANADVWARSLLPFGEHAAWGSISLDPGATLVEALKWLAYACAFFAAATLAKRRGMAFVLALVFGSATLLAIVTLIHGMVDAHKVFGIYQPAAAFAGHHMGPLLNTNNLAGYVILGAISGTGLILMRRPVIRPWLVAVGVAVDIGAIIRSASRGGVGALLIGLVVLAGLAWQRSKHSKSLRQRAAPLVLLGATAAFGGGLALLGGDVFVWSELLSDNLAKLKIVTWCAPLLREYAWLGVGRGAFETVFEAYRPASGLHIIYTHPENFPAQWASEWGVVVAVLALGAFAWLFRPNAMGATRSAVAAAGWTAVLALLVQNMADLGLEIPAIGFATAVVLGALWGDPNRRRRRRSVAVDKVFARVGQRRFAIAVAALGVAFAALSLSLGLRDVGMQRDAMREAFERATDEPNERPAFRAALHAAMKRRPAEHYFPLLGAMAAFRWKDDKPMPWLEHTLERAPVNGRAHALLASVLASRGARKQALFELRLAVDHEPGLTDTVMPIATSLGKDFDDLMVAVPEGPAGAPVLAIMARSLKPEQVALRRRVDAEALERNAKLVEPRTRLLADLFAAMQQLAAGKEPAAPAICSKMEACTAEVEKHAAAIDAAKPDASLGAVMRARGLIAAGKRAEADALLAEGCARPEGRGECLEVRVGNLMFLPEPEKLDAALKEYMSDGCTSAATCAVAATFVGSVRQQRGDLAAAAAAFLRAAQEDPTEERWMRAADSAEKAKMSAQAVEALQHVGSLRGGADAEINARIARVRAQAQADQLLRFR
jgi:hypothetical protein